MTVYILYPFLMVPLVALWSVSVAFPEHTNLFVFCLVFLYIAFCCCCFCMRTAKAQTSMSIHTV